MTISALGIALFFSQVIAPQNTGARADLYVNVDVLRVDPSASTISFRDEQGEKTLSVDSSASDSLKALKAGDRVILGCQVTRDAGKEARLVIEIRKAAPPSLSRVTGPVRAVSVDAKAHVLTVADANGAREI